MSNPALRQTEPSSSPPSGVSEAIPSARKSRWPSAIPYIVGNEAAERFSYYGMRAILWVHLAGIIATRLPQQEAGALATERVHLFMAGVYLFPLIGAALADRLLGKYRTIIALSLVYCAGHAVMSLSDFYPGLVGGQETGLYLGLALIALGSGGIKPCVSANVGDQFDKSNADLVPKVFQIFYFSINFGSAGATLLIPWMLEAYGPGVAFGVPGLLMFIATFVFWLGRDKYVRVPPSPGGKLGLIDAAAVISLFVAFSSLVLFGVVFHGAISWPVRLVVAAVGFVGWFVLFRLRQRIETDKGFISVVVYALTHQRERQPGQGFFDVARAKFGDEAAEGPPAVMRIMGVFAMVTVFWALFEQHSSTWIQQATQMNLTVSLFGMTELTLLPSQIPALNPFMVMALIPFLNFVVYPLFEKVGVRVTPLRKMATGMFLTSLSFVTVALLQMRIDEMSAAGQTISVLWQIAPYLVITTAEVLVSTTGLEFAYTQAPRSMKSTIMGFWLLTVTMGNLLVAFLARFENLSLANFFWVFAALMGVAAVAFAVVAALYKGRSYLQEEAAK